MSTTHRLPGLDHLRALAIIIVFLYHYQLFGHPYWIDTLGSFGWTGVDLFFVLSGYLIGGQLMSSIKREGRINYGSFYVKRIFRIIPAYLAVLILYYTFPAFTERSSLPPLWKFLTFTQNFGLDLSKNAAFSHAWSLCIEEQFYLILPLVMIALVATNSVKKGIWLLPLLFVLGFAVRIYNWQTFIEPTLESGNFGVSFYKWMYYPTYNRLDGLLVGLSLAALFTFAPALKERLTRYGNVLLLISLVLIAGTYWLCINPYSFDTAVFGYPLISISYGVMVLAALSPSCILYKYSSRLTRLIATISFSLYLTHKQLIHLTHLMLKGSGIDTDSYILFWISVLVSLLGAAILYFTVEKPFLRLRDYLLSKKDFALTPVEVLTKKID